MKKALIIFLGLIVCLQFPKPGGCREESRKFTDGLAYRQQEFYGQWKYLSAKEAKIAEDLNREIEVYNTRPSLVALQRIEDLKIKAIENLQDQIKNDRDYIAYLEATLSESAGDGFTALKLKGKGETAVDKIEEIGDAPFDVGKDTERLIKEIQENLKKK